METLPALSNSDFETDNLTAGPRLEKQCMRLENLLTGLNITSNERKRCYIILAKGFLIFTLQERKTLKQHIRQRKKCKITISPKNQ